ncbi:hypothetical protein Tco_0175826, partial [Tanacetum coccineum]
MVDEQINTTPSTESDEIKKSSVEILNLIPRESNDAKECEISIKGNSMEFKFQGFENEIITVEKDVFQNEVISNQEKINDICETERDLKFFDDLLNENTLPPDVSNRLIHIIRPYTGDNLYRFRISQLINKINHRITRR